MIEIVFGESAAGSLKIAKSHRKKGIQSPVIAVIPTAEGQSFSDAELEKLRKEGEDRFRREWEASIPLEGGSGDVYDLGLLHSIGDISGDASGEARLQWLLKLHQISSWGRDDSQPRRKYDDWLRNWKQVQERMEAGEAVRLWYSDSPDDRCGLCWFLAQISRQGLSLELWAVKLPDWDPQGEVVVQYSGWGEVRPGEWGRHAQRQQKLPKLLVLAAANQWRFLQRENAPLRAVVNAKLVSVPEDFYDPFIRKELALLEKEFREERLIGSVLGRQRLGVGDGWLALRIQAMVESGELIVLSEPEGDEPEYHRLLCKR